MADNAAHISAGPYGTADGDSEIVATPPSAEAHGTMPPVVVVPTFSRFAGKPGSDVELIGRSSLVATLPGREPALAGGGASTSTAGFGVPVPSAAPSERRAAEDGPRWSFRGRSDFIPAPPPPPTDATQAELPLAPPLPDAPPRPSSSPLFGPMGRPRAALLVPLASVLTLGVASLVWYQRVNREMEEFDPKLHARPARTAAALSIPWAIGLLVTLAGAARLVLNQAGVHLPFDPHVTVTQAYLLLGGVVVIPYLTLLLSLSATAVVMTLERLRSVEEHLGVTTDRQVRPVAATLLLAIPVVGGLILLAIQQRRLNAIWAAVAPSGHPIT